MTPLRPALALFALSVVLAGCGWMNPMNWFNVQQVAPNLDPEGGYPKIDDDPRALVATVTDLKVERSLTGAIVYATGLPPTQGWWDASLLAENDGMPVDGVITYRFVTAAPDPASADAQRVASPESREITASAFIPAPRLAEARRIVVVGAANTRAVTR